ncbi:MAG: hypothetical protein OEY23_10575 [Acidimicrobiia bacterium]|nr:hypothetical protein [Acidimicrobiia bacterium]
MTTTSTPSRSARQRPAAAPSGGGAPRQAALPVPDPPSGSLPSGSAARAAPARLSFEAVDPAFLAHFWAGVTGYRTVVNEPDYVRIEGSSCGVEALVFHEVEAWKSAPNRVGIELVAADLERETKRLLQLGAKPWREVDAHGERRLLLRDPEGNEFAVVGPRSSGPQRTRRRGRRDRDRPPGRAEGSGG